MAILKEDGSLDVERMNSLPLEEWMDEMGGHWTAVNRPHKNKKKYDRKRDHKIDSDGLFNFLFI